MNAQRCKNDAKIMIFITLKKGEKAIFGQKKSIFGVLRQGNVVKHLKITFKVQVSQVSDVRDIRMQKIMQKLCKNHEFRYTKKGEKGNFRN